MRLALYYSLHTTWNQLRKLFRTWVFLIAVGILVGGGFIGFGAIRFTQEAQTYQDPTEAPLPENIMEFFDASGLSGTDAFELGAGLTILSLLTMQVLGAEKSVSRLFLPADVNFLFPSDRSPQEVLSFRLFTTLGTAVVASIYLFLQMPALVARLHISSLAAWSILIAWCLTIAFSILLKILTFEFGTRHRFIKKNLRYVIILALAALFFLLYHSYITSSEQIFLLSAHRMFNAPWTRWIPVWGWLKGIMIYALEGNFQSSVILIGLCGLLILILLVLVRVFPIDYYEEAAIRCEEIALFMENVNSDNAGLLVTRARHRDESIERDGFHHGSGASIFFYRTLYNRFRFARFGLFTKTFMTYLLVAGAGGMFVRLFMDEPSIYPPIALLAVTVFFRTIASPMSEDIRKDSFLRMPENTWFKLGFSLLGGSLNCAMDIAIPLIAGSMIAGMNPLHGLLFLPLMVSIDGFATAAGTFVDVAIPASVDKTLKQVVQILLLYFGMIPDEMIISFGLITHHAIAANILVVLVNLFLALLFLGLAGVWLNPVHGIPARNPAFVVDEEYGSSITTRICLALLAMYVTVAAAQYSLTELFASSGSFLYTLSAYFPVYLIGFPVFWFFTQHMRRETGERRSLSRWKLFLAFTACLFVMYSGNFLSLTIRPMIRRLQFLPIPLPVLTEGTVIPIIPILCICILSPILEEVVFRRMIIDRTRFLGEAYAVVLSAVLFGLFHGNILQVFYATFLGIVFGYIYLRTNQLRYTITLHMIINTMGSVIAPQLLKLASTAFPDKPLYEVHLLDVLLHPAFLTFFVYLILLIMLSLIGAVVLAWGVKSRRISTSGLRFRDALRSPGMILFAAVMLTLIVASV